MLILKKIIKNILLLLGSIALVMLVLSFTDIPYNAYHSLGTSKNDTIPKTPHYIIVMGGDGMPAPNGLIRLFYAADIANKFPHSKLILALPLNENEDSTQLDLMANELNIKGVDCNRIVYEPHGFNTRSQAVEISKILSSEKDKRLVIVTSPEHMYRAKKTFEKVGFSNVGGLPTFEKPSDESTLKDDTDSKDTRVRNLSLRYNMWSYLNYELLVIREYMAIAYYWIKGWI